MATEQEIRKQAIRAFDDTWGQQDDVQRDPYPAIAIPEGQDGCWVQCWVHFDSDELKDYGNG